jgi:hypothetical protein
MTDEEIAEFKERVGCQSSAGFGSD